MFRLSRIMYAVGQHPKLRPHGEIQSGRFHFARPLAIQNATISPAAHVAKSVLGEAARETHKRTTSPQMVHHMTAEQIKLLAQMLKSGQAKLVQQKDGKLVPVSLI